MNLNMARPPEPGTAEWEARRLAGYEAERRRHEAWRWDDPEPPPSDELAVPDWRRYLGR